jgi:hypothetical protein
MNLPRFTRLVLLAGLLSDVGLGCKNPLDGVVIKFKDPLTTGTLKITCYNPTGGSPAGLKIALRGKDADKIVNLTGGNLIRPSEEGLLGLAVDPRYGASPEQPIEFSIVAEAPGYATRVLFVKLTDLQNREWWMYLLKPESPPQGVSLVQLVNSGKAQELTTPTVGNKQEVARFTLPANLTGLSPDGQAVRSQQLTLTHYDNRSGTPFAFVPGGMTIYRGYDLNGQQLPVFRFLPAGFVSVDAWSPDGALNVVEFSNPYQVEMEINPNTDVGFGPVKPGSRLPLWRYDPATGHWLMLSSIVVESGVRPDKGVVRFSTAKPGFYALAGMLVVCERGPTFVFNTALSGVDLLYYGQLFNAQTGRLVSDFYTDLNNGSRRSFDGLERQPLKFKLFNRNNYTGGNADKPIFESEVFDACDTRQVSVNVSVPQPQPVSMEVKMRCADGKTLDETAFPAEVYVQYKQTGTGNWVDLAKLTRTQKTAQTYRLQMGRRYQFRASPNPATGWPIFQKDTTITQTKYLFDFKITQDGYCK